MLLACIEIQVALRCVVLHLGGKNLHGRYGDRHAGSFPHIDVPQTELPRGVHSEGAVLSLCGGSITHELHCCNRMTMTYTKRERRREREGGRGVVL